jgi:hypothetical protein
VGVGFYLYLKVRDSEKRLKTALTLGRPQNSTNNEMDKFTIGSYYMLHNKMSEFVYTAL